MFIHICLPGNLDKYDGQYEVDSNQLWNSFLKAVIKGDYHFLFDINEQPKPYIAIYLNKQKLLTLNDLKCVDNDTLMIISATSGG
ncbi:hypothetical protein ELY21_02345 [Legionella sp. km535]|uniref:MoaD/ThiS family protein n=1 Tax=Legionella sp. km535 TaxID=2498107 RepID=UPI000F8D15C6|nr:MoaD/ThiS family protein [Legionella sp. km535]RUR19918.1 hypothetical protein ELY21_02345 [Legionella sp. km535]